MEVASSRRFFMLLLVSAFGLMVAGCGSNDPAPAPVGEVMTSKAGADAIKRNGGKPLPKSVPSVDD